MSETPFSKENNIHVHSMIPEDQKDMTTQLDHLLLLRYAFRVGVRHYLYVSIEF